MTWAFLPDNPPQGFAHRGGDDIAPGNTMASFAHAVDLGYDYIETDVRATRDGILVVFHDAELAETSSGKGSVEEHSWAELSQVRIKGDHQIVRLDELVETYPDIRWNIEPKADTAVGPLIEFIRSRSLIDQVCIGSFSGRRVKQMRQALGPRLCTSPGPLGVIGVGLAAIVAPRLLRRATKPSGPLGFAALQVPTRFKGIPLISPWLIKRVHRLGLQVHVWTINDEETMAQLLDWGVDVIMTDRLELLRSVMTGRADNPANEKPNQ